MIGTKEVLPRENAPHIFHKCSDENDNGGSVRWIISENENDFGVLPNNTARLSFRYREENI